MSPMSQPDGSSVVRLAIALAVLKHKPRDQSTASYLLDLQACFPLTVVDSEGQDRTRVAEGAQASVRVDPGPVGVEWRTYALVLEKQLVTLKAQRDADQSLLARLRPDESQSDAAPPPKKKRKKNQSAGKDRVDDEWNWDQTRADWANVLQSQYPLSPSLIEAYTSLKGVLALQGVDQGVYAVRLSDAIVRALESMDGFMFSPPFPAQQQPPLPTSSLPPKQFKSEHLDSARIALVSPLLTYILRVVLPNLIDTTENATKTKRLRPGPSQRSAYETTHTCLDKVLDKLLECVFLPLLRAITPLCVARLAPLVPVPAPRSKKAHGKRKKNTSEKRPGRQTDVRTDVFALLGMSLDALDGLPSQPSNPSQSRSPIEAGTIASGVRDRLGLEAIRELEALYVDPRLSRTTPTPTPTPTGATSQSNAPTTETTTASTVTDNERRAKMLEKRIGTREERVYALARQDAGWFLTSTLSLCVSQAKGECSGLLREALIERIGRLVREVDSGAGVDSVCKSMLLATCERAMSGFTCD